MVDNKKKESRGSETVLRPRSAEFTLGFIGAILGFIAAAWLLRTTFGWVFYGRESFVTTALPPLASAAASIVVFRTISKMEYHAKPAGVIFIICALGEFLSVKWLGIPSAVLYFIAGLMCLIRSDEIDA